MATTVPWAAPGQEMTVHDLTSLWQQLCRSVTALQSISQLLMVLLLGCSKGGKEALSRSTPLPQRGDCGSPDKL